MREYHRGRSYQPDDVEVSKSGMPIVRGSIIAAANKDARHDLSRSLAALKRPQRHERRHLPIFYETDKTPRQF